jgi:hypothetical protein
MWIDRRRGPQGRHRQPRARSPHSIPPATTGSSWGNSTICARRPSLFIKETSPPRHRSLPLMTMGGRPPPSPGLLPGWTKGSRSRACGRLPFDDDQKPGLIVLVFDEGSSDGSVLLVHKAGARLALHARTPHSGASSGFDGPRATTLCRTDPRGASRLPRQLSALAPIRGPFSSSPPWPARDMSGGLF